MSKAQVRWAPLSSPLDKSKRVHIPVEVEADVEAVDVVKEDDILCLLESEREARRLR